MPTVIAVAGQKGGIAKSTVARAIAVELARKKKSVAILDLDLAQRTSVEWAKTRQFNKLSPEITVISTDLDRDGLSAGGDAEYVVLDCPGWSDTQTAEIAGLADLLVLPTGPSDDDVRPLVKLYYELTGGIVPPDRIAVVLVRMLNDAEETKVRAKLKDQAGIEPCAVSLRELATYRTAANTGKAPTEVSNSGPAEEAQALVAEILKRLKTAGIKTSRKTPQKVDLSWL